MSMVVPTKLCVYVLDAVSACEGSWQRLKRPRDRSWYHAFLSSACALPADKAAGELYCAGGGVVLVGGWRRKGPRSARVASFFSGRNLSWRRGGGGKGAKRSTYRLNRGRGKLTARSPVGGGARQGIVGLALLSCCLEHHWRW